MTTRCLLALLALLCVPCLHAQDGFTPLTYDANAAPANNPLKGFIPYVGRYSFPHSMEFNYIGLDEVMDGYTSFTFDTGLEPLLDRMAARGHQAMIRVFIDYPAERNALPDFLKDDGVQQRVYFANGGGRSPDYEDANLLRALDNFIAAFGAQYDGDPRIGFIELGLLGHWGEWHTFPNEDMAPSRATQNRVLAAYDAAFNETKLLVSQDILGYENVADIAERDIGFHDDDFTNNTLPPGDDQFWSRMLAQGLDESWMTRTIGGEVQPDFQEVLFNVPSGAPEDFATAVSTTHASWLLNHAAFENNWPASKRARAEAAAKLLGYELFVAAVRLTLLEDASLEVVVRMENRGVAPFYYDWLVELALLGTDEIAQVSAPTDWLLSTVLPGEPGQEFTALLDTASQPAGTYTAALRVVNPLPNGRRLRFANAEQQDCWLHLGEVNAGALKGEGEGEGESDCLPEGGEGEGEGDEDKSPAFCGPRPGPSGPLWDILLPAATLALLTVRSRLPLAR